MKTKSFQIQKSKMWPLVLGIDIGRESVKYLLLRRTGNVLRVEGFGRYSIKGGEEQRYEAMQDAVRNIINKVSNLKKAKVVVGVGGSNVVIKRESFPPLSKKELVQSALFSVQRELGIEGDVSGIVCDCQPLGIKSEKDGNEEYMLIGMQEELIDGSIKFLVNEGIVPAKVMPSVISLTNLVHFLPASERKRVVGILDIGSRSSMLILVKDGRLDFYREISVGGDDFTNSIIGTIFHEGRAVQFTIKEALEFKLKYGYPTGFTRGMTFKGAPLSEVKTVMRPVVERLISEIQRSIGFYKENSSGEAINSIYFVGGGAMLKNLPEAIEEKLRIPVKRFSLPQSIRISGGSDKIMMFKKRFPEQALSLSLAMEYSSSEANLLPQQYKRVHKLAVVEKSLAYSLAAVVMFLAFMTFNFQSKLSRISSEVAQKEVLLPQIEKNIKLNKSLQNEIITLNKKYSNLLALTKQDETPIQILRMFSHSVPKDLQLVYVEYGKKREENNRKKPAPKKGEEQPKATPWIVVIKGMSTKPNNDVGIYLAKLIVDMEKSGYFSDVKLEKDEWNEEHDSYRFEITANLKK